MLIYKGKTNELVCTTYNTCSPQEIIIKFKCQQRFRKFTEEILEHCCDGMYGILINIYCSQIWKKSMK